MGQTHKNEPYMTAVEVIPSQGSVACHQDRHQDSLRVHSAVARLKGSSAQKTFSTCSSAAVLGLVVRSVVARVNFQIVAQRGL